MAKTKRAKLDEAVKVASDLYVDAMLTISGTDDLVVPYLTKVAILKAFIAGAKWQHDKDKEALKKWLD
jgi:acetylglutamate synthase